MTKNKQVKLQLVYNGDIFYEDDNASLAPSKGNYWRMPGRVYQVVDVEGQYISESIGYLVTCYCICVDVTGDLDVGEITNEEED